MQYRRVLDRVAAAHGIAVIEDAAHAIGAVHHDRSCGSFGDVGCFSFFSNKNLPSAKAARSSRETTRSRDGCACCAPTG